MIVDTLSVSATLIVFAISIAVAILVKHTYTSKKHQDK